ncbi:hypothetical protein Mp_Mg00880, partial (mitochondrion) [Marchantia polymorpha subsp. ruderalis]
VRLGRARLDQRRLTDYRTALALTCSGNRPQGTIAWVSAEFRRTVFTSASESSVTPSNEGGPEGTKDQLNPLCKQPYGGNCRKQEKSLTNLNDEQTTKRENEGSPQWTPKRLVPRCQTPGDRGISKNVMGDRSVISTPRDTLGKPSRVYDDARNVKDSEGRTVDGNVPAEKAFFCQTAHRHVVRRQKERVDQQDRAENGRLRKAEIFFFGSVAESAKATTKTKANKGESRPVTPPALGRVFYEDIYNIDNLRAGYKRLKGNVAPGIDGRTKADMTDKALEKLSKELRRQAYAPKPAKRIIITKPDGGSRPLSIASTVDKVVQSTLKELVEPHFESLFRDSSHGFRPGRSCHKALRDLRYSWTALTWLVQIDIKKDFDKIHHDLLIKEMESVLRSKALQDLMRKLFNAGYIDVYNLTDRTQYNTEGVPQGSIISPLCANIFLHKLDCYVEDILIPNYNVGNMRPASAEYKKRLNIHSKDKAFFKYYTELEQAIKNIKHLKWINREQQKKSILVKKKYFFENLFFFRNPKVSCPLGRRTLLEMAEKEGLKRLKYLRYADNIILGVIGSKQDALDIRKAVQNFLQEELKLDINEQKSKILHAKSEMAKYLGALVIYYGTGSVEILSKVSDVKQIRLRSRPQLIAPIKDLITKALELGYAKKNAKGLARATSNPRLVSSGDKHIVIHFSSVIRGIVNYYSFVNKRSSLWKVVSIYKKSCALTLARKHGLRSAKAALLKFGPNLRITEKGKEVASLYYPTSLKTTGKFHATRFSQVTILEEPYYGVR